MKDLLWQIEQTSAFTVYTTAAMAVAAFLFLREIANSPVMATLSVPIVMAGGVLSTAIFQRQMIVLAFDPDTNVAAMAGIGAIVALSLMIGVKWIWTIADERRVASIDLPPVAPKSRIPH